jgi:hypothetical protein
MASTPRWGGLRPEPYKQNAVDADGDGVVQEGTAFERPAGTSILDGAGSPLSDGLSSLERDTSWSVVDRNGQRISYTPSYGGAFEQAKPKTLKDSVGTLAVSLGTIGDRVGTVETSSRSIKAQFGTITEMPEPLPIPQVPIPEVEDSNVFESFKIQSLDNYIQELMDEGVPGYLAGSNESGELYRQWEDGLIDIDDSELQDRMFEIEENARNERFDRLEDITSAGAVNTLRTWIDGQDGATRGIRDDAASPNPFKETEDFVEMIKNSPIRTESLFRGMMINEDELNQILNSGRINFPVGATSSSISSSSEYAGITLGDGANSVLFEINDAPAFPAHLFSRVDENEWLVSGDFEVVGEYQWKPDNALSGSSGTRVIKLRPAKSSENAVTGKSSATHFGTVSKGPVRQMQSVEFGEYKEWFKDSGGMPDENSQTKEVYSFPVYETNGKKISFGTENIGRFKPQFTDNDVELIPINPFVISGLDKSSAEGEKFATLFFDATQGQAIEDSNYDARNRTNDGQVSALLYAAARGDNEALEELERLANIGREYAAEQRANDADEALAFMGDRSEPYDWARNYPEIMIDTGEVEDFTKVRRPMNIDDLFLVHQTTYKPEFDSNGDIVIRPTKDFVPIDPATGKQYVDSVTGELRSSIDQNNIHFSLNHLVGGHTARALPTDGSYVIVVPLRDVLDANPGALDNLYAIDTFLTPKPGEGITIPMNKGEVVTTPKLSDYGFTASVDDMSKLSLEQLEEYEKISEDIKEKSISNVEDALASVGKVHNGSDKYVTKIIPGGDSSSTYGVDRRISLIGKEILPEEYQEYVGGVTNGIHDGTPTSKMMNLIAQMDTEQRRIAMADPDYWKLGPNAKLRFFDNNKFTSGEIITTYQEEISGL